jgi:hypothetical protein
VKTQYFAGANLKIIYLGIDNFKPIIYYRYTKGRTTVIMRTCINVIIALINFISDHKMRKATEAQGRY